MNFLIYQPKHMLWVLKITVPMLKLMNKNILSSTLKSYVYASTYDYFV